MKARFWILLVAMLAALIGLFVLQYQLLLISFDSERSELRRDISNTLGSIITLTVENDKRPFNVLDSLQGALMIDYKNKDKESYYYTDAIATNFIDSFSQVISQTLRDSFPDLDADYGIFLESFSVVDSLQRTKKKIVNGGLKVDYQLLGTIEEGAKIFSNSTNSTVSDSLKVVIKNGLTINNEREAILNRMRWKLGSTFLIGLLLLGFCVYTLFTLSKLNRTLAKQKDFVDNIIHEFQTPITSIQLAAKQVPQLDLQTFIIGQSKRLSRLIAQVKNGQWSEQNLQLERKAVDLYPFLKKIIADYRLQYASEEIDLRFSAMEIPMVSLIDAHYFRMVLQNILDNAIIHNNHKVNIELSLEEREGQHYIHIQDDGKGIAPQWQNQIFEKYERANADTPGLGIGLHLCKQIVEKHSGNISLESNAQAGATFIIQIASYDS